MTYSQALKRRANLRRELLLDERKCNIIITYDYTRFDYALVVEYVDYLKDILPHYGKVIVGDTTAFIY